MPQGKFKVKNSAPVNVKKPKKVANIRKNCPIAPKKWKFQEGERIKRMISKNVNRKVEEEIRSLANDVPKIYSSKKKKQIQHFVKSQTSDTNKPAT